MNDPEQGDDATHHGFGPTLSDDGEITDSGDESEDSQPDVDHQGDCLKTCEPPFRNRREAAYRRKQRIRRLRVHLERARERLRELAKYLLHHRPNLGYDIIVKLATSEENGSSVYLHPGLKLRAPSGAEKEQYRAGNGRMTGTPAPTQASHPATGPDSISRLPVQILGRILRSLLVFDGQPVHVVSRLDPHHSPDLDSDKSIQTDTNGAGLRLMNRFHVGNASVSLGCAIFPNVLLAPLGVCRRWNYIGGNLFYSLNHFCFSSLGE
ncbi:hypothetical protein MY11210_001269 [Beauveria gryllotalpidicola]